MKISDGEKLILLMLSDIYDKLNIDDSEINPNFIRSAIFDNQIWAIPWEYSGIPFDNDEDQPKEVGEVADILVMWNFIEYSYEKLPEDEKERFGNPPEFLGFDGNYERVHLSIASFLVNELGRFYHFKGRTFNSHRRCLEVYKRMLPVYNEIQESREIGPLSFNELKKIMKEKIHPENRENDQ